MIVDSSSDVNNIIGFPNVVAHPAIAWIRDFNVLVQSRVSFRNVISAHLHQGLDVFNADCLSSRRTRLCELYHILETRSEIARAATDIQYVSPLTQIWTKLLQGARVLEVSFSVGFSA